MKAILLKFSEKDFIRLRQDKIMKSVIKGDFLNWEEYIILLLKGGEAKNVKPKI